MLSKRCSRLGTSSRFSPEVCDGRRHYGTLGTPSPVAFFSIAAGINSRSLWATGSTVSYVSLPDVTVQGAEAAMQECWHVNSYYLTAP